jgi:hypothetical protein
MADRYWRGGTAAWDGTAGSKWADTAGGATGAAVPTSLDDVFFDATSSGTCTISAGNTGAKSINCTGFTGTLTQAVNINVAGNVTLVAGMTFTTSGFPTTTFTANATLITAGKSYAGVVVDGVGITVTLGSALTTAGLTVTVNRGTFDTANYNVTCPNFNSSNSNVRGFTLGSSTCTLSTGNNVVDFTTGTNLTFNAGTSQINCSAADAGFNASGQTFYNVAFTNTTAGTRIILGANTFNNLSVAAPSSAGVAQLTFNSNQTINGTFSTTGTAGNRRVWFRSDTYGVRRTLTVNSAPSLTDADFRDIIVNGTAAPLSGTRIGNRGACAGITFDAPKTVYWNLAGAQNWNANGWATTSTGTPSTDNFPLPQDTATFTNAGSAGTIAFVGFDAIGNIDMSGRTSAMTLSTAQPSFVYGSWTNGSGTALSGSGTITFAGEGTKTITSAGKSFTGDITIDAYGGTVELADALTIPNNSRINVTNGTFDTKNFNVTGGGLISSNNNVRTVKFGSSTLTFAGANSPNPIGFGGTNLTFDAGTSQINCSATNAQILGSSQTFYNVSFTSTSTGTRVIAGANTFNNLSLTASATGLSQLNLNDFGQIITGTLTIAGSSATQRAFVFSNTLGTPRTLTVNSLSANDCDFRDITIAGTAAGASPTRAGDCGGNSGITFPAPKTVYWNLAGTQSWNDTGWAPSSGGSPAINEFPLAQDTAVFDEAGSAGTVFFTATYNTGTLDASGRTSAMTFNYNGANVFYGNYILGSGVTLALTVAAAQIFSGRGTQTLTTAGKTFLQPITVNSFSGTVQLGDALTLPSNRTLTLTSGTFDAVTYNVTAGAFNSNNSNVRTLRMGSGLWTITSTGTIWDFTSTTNLLFLKGTADLILSNTSTSDRTFTGGGLSYNKLTIGGATGVSTLTITGNNQFTELASTKTVAHTIALGTTTQTFGAWTVTGTVGNVVTLTGTGTSHVLAGSATSSIDYLAMGSIGFSNTSTGEFYAGANSTGTAVAPVFRTAPPAARTLYWVGGTGNWSDTARWSLLSGGAGGEATPISLDDVVFDTLSNLTAYTATVNAITGGNRCNQLTIAGPASGNVTLAGSNSLFIHGDVTLPATGLTRTYTGAITLSSSTTGKTFTTNGVTLAGSITVNGVGCGWTLGSALNIGTPSIIVTNGTFDTGNYNVSCGAFNSTNLNSRTITLGSSTVTSSASIDFRTSINLTFNAGTSEVIMTSNNVTFSGGEQTFYNVSFTSTSSSGTKEINGSNSFNNLSVTGASPAVGVPIVSINADQTINGTLTLSASSSAAIRTFVCSNTIGTTRTLTCNAVATLQDIDFRDITIAGSAAPVSGTRLGDCKGNSGITFDAPKTVYFRGSSGNWGSNVWSFTNGGSLDITSFPLAQDTAVFPSSPTPYPSSGNTVTINAAYNIGTIDMSARTGNTMTLATGSQTPTIYGNWINGTGTTLSGTNIITFSGRGTQTITSAGKTFTQPITINSPSGTVQLGDSFISSNVISLNRGTFDAVTYNVTVSAFDVPGTTLRTINMGSGLWTLTGNGFVWVLTADTNTTVNKGTANFLLSQNSTASRTFNGGDRSYNKLTIGGNTTTSITSIRFNNQFTEIASTKTVAHTLDLVTFTQRVGAWTVTGTSGNVVTITGNTSNLIYTGAGSLSGLDYLNVQGRAYGSAGEITSVWYAGANSTNSGSLGWEFAAGTPPTPPVANANFFLLFA